MTLGTPVTMALSSLRKPPKKGTTLVVGMSSARPTASRYSGDGSLVSIVSDSTCIVLRSSSEMDSQKGFSFSDLREG